MNESLVLSFIQHVIDSLVRAAQSWKIIYPLIYLSKT